MKKLLLIMSVILLIITFTTGCMKEYKKPLIVEANPNETLIVIPLEGDNIDTQSKLDSIDYLKEKKIATKRIELTQRWLKTGRLNNSGGYIPNQQVIKVDRTPVNLEWTADSSRGSSNNNQGIIGEDEDSVSFAIDWYVTATVLESEAHNYLYWYGINKDSIKDKNGYPYSVKARQLKDVVDTEVRRMVSKLFTAKTSKSSLDEIIKNKDKINKEINEEIKKHFGEKGITITACGWTGDITYFDSNVQKAINQEFIADRERKAQEKKNQMELAIAENKVKVAEQERLAAEERQKAWDIIQQRRELDILEKYVDLLNEKWDGSYPKTLLRPDNNNSQPFILDLPMPQE